MPSRSRTVIRTLYLYKALVDFILLYPLYNVMFASRGLSTFQISTLLIIWSSTDLITNVPTGVLADRFSRRKLLALAPLIEAAGFLAWLFWPSYLGFAIGFILWGIGGAIFDGTYEALLYDELKSTATEHLYVRVAGRAQSFALMANLAATVLAGAAIMLGYGFVIKGSVAALLLAAVVAMRLPETKSYETVADTRYFVMLRQGIMQALHNRTLLGVILLGGFIGTIYGSLEEYVPLFFTQAGYGRSLIPLIVAATVLAAAVASFSAHRYEHLKSSAFMLLLFLTGLLLFVAGRWLGVSSIILLVAYTFIIKLLGTVFDGKVQHSISGGLRATVTSVSMFVVEVMSITTYLLYGLLSRHGGNAAAFRVIGIGVALIALGYGVLAPHILANRIVHKQA